MVVENISFERMFKNYDSRDTFHFIDPPYENTANGAYSGWDHKQLTTFRREVGRLKGKWVVTLNDSAFTRSLFAGCEIKSVVSENRAVNRRTHAEQKFGEIIITPK